MPEGEWDAPLQGRGELRDQPQSTRTRSTKPTHPHLPEGDRGHGGLGAQPPGMVGVPPARAKPRAWGRVGAAGARNLGGSEGTSDAPAQTTCAHEAHAPGDHKATTHHTRPGAGTGAGSGARAEAGRGAADADADGDERGVPHGSPFVVARYGDA
ncbi:hypothetical protein FE633_18750 [Streptomyces montanus]|uniref:Uncharacterized protein n=1 Tax=Streptomyces montanus TaxID=2580423 RepID=A0A5R9FVY8_9ACTN|nr:hypothetical protein FE633_18750 [Streptomyces montanus]